MKNGKPASPSMGYGPCSVPFPKDLPCWLSAMAGKKTMSVADQIYYWMLKKNAMARARCLDFW